MPIFLIFAFVLATLKLLGYIAVSWLVVVLVALVPLVLFLIFAAIFFGGFFVFSRRFG